MKKVKYTRDIIHTGYCILVNQFHPYVENKCLMNLVPLQYETTIYLNMDANDALNQIMEKINGWDSIVPISGYRSFEEQTKLYNQSLLENGEEFTSKFVALPGCSEHQTGLAIDLALKTDDIDFICPDFPYEGVCQRFRDLAPMYGFIERYGKEVESITHIAHEPWHFRYVGYPHSLIMKELDMCLEEYCEYIQTRLYDENVLVYKKDDENCEVSYIPCVDNELEVMMDDKSKWFLSGDNCKGLIYVQFR